MNISCIRIFQIHLIQKQKFSYYLKAKSKVKLTVFDVMGRVVASINKGAQDRSHFVSFNAAGTGKSLSSGVYYYRLDADFSSDTKMMLLIK
ncbi:MAG: T9SS type A sorting domain-containing protein [Ignavibacteria bacterium]